MRLDQLTIKAQEALQEAQRDARARGNAELTGDHLLLALLKQDDGVVVPVLQKLGANPEALDREIEAELDRRPKVSGASADAVLARDLSRVFDRAFEVAKEFGDEYVSTEHFLRGPGRVGRRHREAARAGGRQEGRPAEGAQGSPRIRADHGPEPGGQVPGPEALHARPDGPRPPRQDRSRHRARRGDPPRRPGPLAAHEEQPGPDRRARRRQDRDRRGPRPPHPHGRRARGPEEQARRLARPRRHDRRRQVPRRVRGPPEGRPEGDRGGPGHDHPLHRRAAHARRRRRRPRAPWTPRTC